MPAIPVENAQVYELGDAKMQRMVLIVVFVILLHLVALVSFDACGASVFIFCLDYNSYSNVYLTKTAGLLAVETIPE